MTRQKPKTIKRRKVIKYGGESENMESELNNPNAQSINDYAPKVTADMFKVKPKKIIGMGEGEQVRNYLGKRIYDSLTQDEIMTAIRYWERLTTPNERMNAETSALKDIDIADGWGDDAGTILGDMKRFGNNMKEAAPVIFDVLKDSVIAGPEDPMAVLNGAKKFGQFVGQRQADKDAASWANMENGWDQREADADALYGRGFKKPSKKRKNGGDLSSWLDSVCGVQGGGSIKRKRKASKKGGGSLFTPFEEIERRANERADRNAMDRVAAIEARKQAAYQKESAKLGRFKTLMDQAVASKKAKEGGSIKRKKRKRS